MPAACFFGNDFYAGIVIVTFICMSEGTDEHTTPAASALDGVYFELSHYYTFLYKFEPLSMTSRQVGRPASTRVGVGSGLLTRTRIYFSMSSIRNTTGFFESEQHATATFPSSQGNLPPYFKIKRAGWIS